MLATSLKKAFAVLGLGVLMVNDGSASESGTNTNTFQLTTLKEPMMGREPVVRAHVTCGTKKFTFVVPEGFRLDASNPEAVMLVSQDFSSFITLRVANGNAAQATDASTYRESILRRFDETQILDEFSLAAAGRIGPAFDVRGKTPEGLTRNSRVAYIACGGRVLEFCLVSSPEKFGPSQSELNVIMLTFRTSEVGEKTEIAVLSDHI